jgi:CheY-like chemotaxis protein
MASSVIVVLDGDWACRALLDAVLTDAGYQTVVWDGASDPCALIAGSRPDLVVLDTWLHQRHDGLDLLQRLWGAPATAALPVVVCTTYPHALTDRLSVPAAQPYAVVEKPFALADLLTAVATLAADRQHLVTPQLTITHLRRPADAFTAGVLLAPVP